MSLIFSVILPSCKKNLVSIFAFLHDIIPALSISLEAIVDQGHNPFILTLSIVYEAACGPNIPIIVCHSLGPFEVLAFLQSSKELVVRDRQDFLDEMLLCMCF